ncbi:MAG: hypothetical protein R6W78_06755 [Bacteroidales bacterium]
MRKTYFLIIVGIFFVLVSCKKDDPFEMKYTKESVEESKASVEDNAMAMLDKVKELEQVTAIEVLMNLNDLSQPVMLKSEEVNTIMMPLALMKTIRQESVVSDVQGMLKTTASALEDPMSISDEWDEVVGKYTYNFMTGEFDKTEMNDAVVFKFPGKEGDKTNTAEITINNFDVYEVTDPLAIWPEDFDNVLPKSLKIELTYKGAPIAGFEFSASYKPDGMPVKVTTKMTLDDFSFALELTHSPYSEASFKETFKYENQILFEFYAKANGNWSEDNLEDFTDDKEFEEIVNSANAHFIFMNIKVAGQVNIKGLADKMTILEDDYADDEYTESQFTDEMVKTINSNAKMVVVYTDENRKIASAEAYKYHDEEWDDYWVDMRFVFKDGSKVDIETYFTEQMDNFYEELADFIDEISEKYNLEEEDFIEF